MRMVDARRRLTHGIAPKPCAPLVQGCERLVVVLNESAILAGEVRDASGGLEHFGRGIPHFHLGNVRLHTDRRTFLPRRHFALSARGSVSVRHVRGRIAGTIWQARVGTVAREFSIYTYQLWFRRVEPNLTSHSARCDAQCSTLK